MSTKRGNKSSAKHAEKADKKRECSPTAEEKSLSIEEKLALVEKEFCVLRDFCLKSGYSPLQIEEATTPFLNSIKKAKRKKWARFVVQFFMFVIFAYGLFSYDPVYRVLLAYGRQTSIKLLPVWDWTRMFYKECLLNNPYYNGVDLKEEDCGICENFEPIAHVTNISAEEVVEKYIYSEKPLIVSDGIEEGSLFQNLSIQLLEELYHNHPILVDYEPCSFRSNFKKQYLYPHTILKKAVSGELTGYYAHWENCFKPAAKVFREYYKRPYFLSPVVQMDDTNWIYISSGFKSTTFRPIDIKSTLIILIQAKGQINFQLSPKNPCGNLCPVLNGILDEGEILLFVPFIWSMEYLPSEEEENLSVGIGANFDRF
ncbi:uncharacterized protein LOC115216908 [Octopus sinensis]|uniref:Uncharacterized protein LOC115216908 n=1 Tax=Octopus sinensis TaxID=2607531 RepID=A0A6P7SVI7_9MOLL|nr:uncharacterized protein LOC115216908 [Octopus sinensis]